MVLEFDESVGSLTEAIDAVRTGNGVLASCLARGKPPGGTAPYGFRRIQGAALLVEPKEARIVRTIFEFSDRHEPPRLIALQLNHAAFARRNGKPWNCWQVAAILKRREFYERGILP